MDRNSSNDADDSYMMAAAEQEHDLEDYMTPSIEEFEQPINNSQIVFGISKSQPLGTLTSAAFTPEEKEGMRLI
jgi:hypothetical protein